MPEPGERRCRIDGSVDRNVFEMIPAFIAEETGDKISLGERPLDIGKELPDLVRAES